MRARLATILLVCACGKGGSKKADDWTKFQDKVTDASTGGVQYQITLPENWVKREPPDQGWEAPLGDKFERPTVTVMNVSLDMASSLESAISAVGAKPEDIVRKETKPDGYALTDVHQETWIRATVFKKAGGSYLWCTATEANDSGIPLFEHTKTALVKICDSVTPK